MKRTTGWIMLVVVLAIVGCSTPTAKGKRFSPDDDYKVMGYSTRSLIPRKYQTVSVPIFGNRTLERRFEFELTQTVIEMIEDRTHLKVVNDGTKADTRLTGIVLDFKRRVLSENTDDQVQESQVVLTVGVKWLDQKTGQNIVDTKIRETTEAVYTHGETEGSAAREAFRDIAERIVEKMESDW